MAYIETRNLTTAYLLRTDVGAVRRRDQQILQLPLMWDQMAVAFAKGEACATDSEEWLMGSWSRFVGGFVATTSVSAAVQAAIILRGKEVLGGAGGTGGGGVA